MPTPLVPRIVAIGATTGGPAAVRQILQDLAPDLAAAVLIALQPRPHDALDAMDWNSVSTLPVHIAEHGERIEPGHVYLAPANRYLELTPELHLSITTPPPWLRPAPWTDRLFLSAVAAVGGRTVGVVLTGSDADGAQGMLAIHDAGGIGIVQEPSDAVDPSMPLSCLRIDHPDHCLPLRDIGALLNSLVAAPRAIG
jgi:two-component system chemotaxis response regulator CheB